ncbi:MAG: PAS domain S-box protein [Chloroflexi bacterium]|nr:PAS domain S-box protein [Chloroflexota bacterium]
MKEDLPGSPLRHNESDLRLLLNSIRAPILALTEDLTILYCNQAFSVLARIPIADLEGHKLPDLLPSFTRSRSFAAYLNVLQTGQDQMVEGPINNSYLHSWVYRTPWGVLAIGEDITRHRQTEGALRESQARYQTLFETANDAIFLLTPADDIIDANQRACQMMGYDLPTLLHMRFSDLQASDAANAVPLSPDGAPFESLFRHRDGRLIPVELTTALAQADSASFIFCIVRDITERKQAEETLRQTQKTESLGILAGGVAHDFNNLLVAMLGQATLALAKLPEYADARPHIEKSIRAAENAAHLTRQLLAYSGRGQFEKRAIQVNALIQDHLHLFQVAVPKHIDLRSDLSEPLPAIEGDLGQIQQVVMNLIINAVEAIGERPGIVTVRTNSLDLDEENGRIPLYSNSSLPPGRYVCLEVQDDGHGMDAATLAKIFDPFFTTKHSTGHGLGLAAVLGILRGHKAGLQVSTHPGQGATFRLFFPAIHPSAKTQASPKVDTGPLRGSVLVIDDEALVREAVVDILELRQVRVIEAENGRAGLDAFRENQKSVRLIILDLSMPGMSGEETFHALRQCNPRVKIILSSGYSQTEIGKRFTSLAATAFLQKPYSAAELLQVVEMYLDTT